LLAFSAISEVVFCNADEMLLARCAEQVTFAVGELAIGPMIDRQVDTLAGCHKLPTINKSVTLNDKLKVSVRVQVGSATVGVLDASDFDVAHDVLLLPDIVIV
jgi:hypothetical protein